MSSVNSISSSTISKLTVTVSAMLQPTSTSRSSLITRTKLHETHNKYFWCGGDVVQQRGRLSLHSDTKPIHLLFDSSGTRQSYAIPIIELTKVLRNSSDIIPIVTSLRERRINEHVKNNNIPSGVSFGDAKAGHCISSAPIVYNKLQGTDQEDIALQIVESEVDLLLSGGSFKPYEVAILHE